MTLKEKELIGTRKELIKHCLELMEKYNTFAMCKECGGLCCKTYKPKGCRFMSEDGCTHRNLFCILLVCEKWRLKFPELIEYFDEVRKELQWSMAIVFRPVKRFGEK